MDNKMLTLEDAISYAASEKTKKGKKWEGFVQKNLHENKFLPSGDLIGSIFKTTKFSFKIDERDISGHQKITDLYLPKFNHLVEDKTALSDSTEHGIILSVKSLMESKEYGDDFTFVLLLEEKPAPAMFARFKLRADTYATNFRYYIGKDGVADYIRYLKTLEDLVQKKPLPMGKIEWVKFSDLIDNEKNRTINMRHVYDLVDSILSKTHKDGIRGLVRTFIGFTSKTGKVHLVDAHHLKVACTIINKYTEYHIDEVPVYILDHLGHLSEAELTTLMTTINTLVLKWETFEYVKIWEKTYSAIGDKNRLFPYETLRKSMQDVSKHLGQDSPNSAPIVQAFCLEGRADESNWKANTKKINYGDLYFTPDTYDNKLKPIVDSVKEYADTIDNVRDIVGSKFEYKDETYNVPSKTVATLRAYATELSLQEKDFPNKDLYHKSLKVLSNGYWEETNLLPNKSTKQTYTRSDWNSLANFPRTGDSMKKFVRDSIMPDVITIANRKPQK